jgi:hypothetical protein
MRFHWICLCVLALSAPARPQATLPGGDWRGALRRLPENPPPDAGPRDLQRFEESVRLAAPYLLMNQSGDVEANRELVRRMWTYLAGMDVLARSPGADRSLGRAIQRARGTVGSLGLAYPFWLTQGSGPSQAAPPPPAPKPGQPPFSMQAPEIGTVAAADQAVADELTDRYETTAAKAGAAWQSADVLNKTLNAKGMTLNQRITESVVRLQLFLELSAGDLRRHNWNGAREHLQRVDYVVNQIGNSVGR